MNRIIAALAVFVLAVPVFGAAPGGMTGQLLGVDGRPADGYRIVLVSAEGEPVAGANTDPEGEYHIPQVAPGEYGIGVVSPAGEAAPVMAAPTRVGSGEQVVRNIRLMEAGSSPVQLAPARGGLGVWWAGLTKPAKIWTVLGTLTAFGLIYSATDDDDDVDEPSVTPFRID